MLAGEAGQEIEVSIRIDEDPITWVECNPDKGYDWIRRTYRVKALANWEIVKAAEEGAEIEFKQKEQESWEDFLEF